MVDRVRNRILLIVELKLCSPVCICMTILRFVHLLSYTNVDGQCYIENFSPALLQMQNFNPEMPCNDSF